MLASRGRRAACVLGVVLPRVSRSTSRPRITDVPTSVIVQFLTTFAVWMLAERLHLSGILTVVVFAILVAQRVARPHLGAGSGSRATRCGKSSSSC